MSGDKKKLPLEMPTVNELHLQQQINTLTGQVTMMQGIIASTIRLSTTIQFSSGMIGQPCSTDETNASYLAGLGPRFRQRYAQCQDDTERTNLLSSLLHPLASPHDYPFHAHIDAQEPEVWLALEAAFDSSENAKRTDSPIDKNQVIELLSAGELSKREVTFYDEADSFYRSVLWYSTTHKVWVLSNLPTSNESGTKWAGQQKSTIFYWSEIDQVYLFAESQIGSDGWCLLDDLLSMFGVAPTYRAEETAKWFKELHAGAFSFIQSSADVLYDKDTRQLTSDVVPIYLVLGSPYVNYSNHSTTETIKHYTLRFKSGANYITLLSGTLRKVGIDPVEVRCDENPSRGEMIRLCPEMPAKLSQFWAELVARYAKLAEEQDVVKPDGNA